MLKMVGGMMVNIVFGALVLVMVILWAVAAWWGCYDG
jgi:hypothetical protein